MPYAEAARLLGYLADPTRLRLLVTLAGGELSVGELCRQAGRPQSSVSQHLGVLRRAGILRTRRGGKSIYYSLATGAAGPGATSGAGAGQDVLRVHLGGFTVTVGGTTHEAAPRRGPRPDRPPGADAC